MKTKKGKRTSVAEYVRKRACGEKARPGKEEVPPACERSGQQEEVKAIWNCFRHVVRKKSTSWKCSGKRAVAM